MKINILSCCFAGHRESKLPYKYGTDQYEKLRNILKDVIKDLIKCGVANWYAGCQNGIDNLASMIVLELKEEIGTTAYLHLIQPYKDMELDFEPRQEQEYQEIKSNADSFQVLHQIKTSNCYRERNQRMVDKSDFLIAVLDRRQSASGTIMTINMAKRKGIEIRIIDAVTYEVETIPAKTPPKLLIEE